MQVPPLLIFIASCALLIFAGGLLVKCLIKLAKFLKLSEFVISFILMAFSTSVPELMVGIKSALIGAPAIALGTVIGSNIADVTLVAGTVAILGRGIKANKTIVRKDAYFMVGICMLAVLLMFIGQELSRIDGVILLSTFIFYIIFLLKRRHEYTAVLPESVKRWSVLIYTLLVPISLILLFYSSDLVVSSGKEVASVLALPPIFVGLFFIAIGTSLPELAFESRAVLAGKPALALGDLIGSVVVNSTLVLGITALIAPITGNMFLFLTSSVFMIICCFLFAVMLESYNNLSWKEGIALLMMYIFFLIVELTLKNYYLVNGI